MLKFSLKNHECTVSTLFKSELNNFEKKGIPLMSILVRSVIRMQYTELREMKAIPTQLSDQSLTKKE